MITKEVSVRNTAGFHVRSASLVTKAAQKYSSAVTLAKSGRSADCKSCLDLLTLMSPKGSTLTLSAEGADAQAAVDEISGLFDVKFYEEEFASLDPSQSS